MVGTLWKGLRRDLLGFAAAVAPAPPPSAGLHTWRGHPRIHLRVHEDGSGVLFIDVMNVVHLNSSATRLAWLALQGVPQERAGRDAAPIYRMIQRFRQPGTGCPTCVEGLERPPLFSTPVRAPFKADLALTYGCNNQCPHCYNEADRLPMPSLPKKSWVKVLDRLHQVGVPHIIFTGGEATLHPDLPELVAHADGLGQVAGLNTNGRRMADRGYLAALEEAGLNHVQVTLASSRPEVHDQAQGTRSFHQTLRGLENAVASPRLHAITNTTLTAHNADHVEEIVEFLHQVGVRTFAMNGMIYSGGGFDDPAAIAPEQMAPLLLRVRDRARELRMKFLWYTPTEYCRMSPVELEIGAKRCNAGEYSLAVEPNGDVLPCQSYYARAGNLLRDPWEQIWNGELFRSFRDREKDPRAAGLPSKCWECPDLPLCGGGCRIEHEAREGRRVGEVAGGCGEARGFTPSPSLTRTSRRGQGREGYIPLPVAGAP